LGPRPAQGSFNTFADGKEQEMIDEGDVFQMFSSAPGIRVRGTLPERFNRQSTPGIKPGKGLNESVANRGNGGSGLPLRGYVV
jgi:hypothetical protein